MSTKPKYLPDSVRLLAETILAGLPFSDRQKLALKSPPSFHLFSDTIEKNEVILFDMCDELPTLAALILVRDTIAGMIRNLEGSDIFDTPEIYLLVPLMCNIKRFLFSLALIACNKFPDIYPDGFKVNPANGHLVLVGEQRGKENIQRFAASQAIKAMAAEETTHTIEIIGTSKKLSPEHGMEVSSFLDEFSVKKKLH